MSVISPRVELAEQDWGAGELSCFPSSLAFPHSPPNFFFSPLVMSGFVGKLFSMVNESPNDIVDVSSMGLG